MDANDEKPEFQNMPAIADVMEVSRGESGCALIVKMIVWPLWGYFSDNCSFLITSAKLEITIFNLSFTKILSFPCQNHCLCRGLTIFALIQIMLSMSLVIWKLDLIRPQLRFLSLYVDWLNRKPAEGNLFSLIRNKTPVSMKGFCKLLYGMFSVGFAFWLLFSLLHWQ